MILILVLNFLMLQLKTKQQKDQHNKEINTTKKSYNNVEKSPPPQNQCITYMKNYYRSLSVLLKSRGLSKHSC